MRLNSLTLCNYGVFQGTVTIPLSEMGKSKGPLTLVFGKNGSGKTTILEAIKTVLYGPSALGQKSQSHAYTDRIHLRLNRYTREESAEYYAELSLTLSQRGRATEHTIRRQWRRELGAGLGLKEELRVTREGTLLTKKAGGDFEAFIRRLLPITAFDMLFLDGESLNELFEGDAIAAHLAQALFPLSGLDVYQHLRRDLDSYLDSENSYSKLGAEEAAYVESKRRYAALGASLIQKEEERGRLIDLESELLASQRSAEDDLRSNGLGQSSAHGQKISALEEKRKFLNEKIRSYVADFLPFLMATPILRGVVEQLRREEEGHAVTNAVSLLNNPSVRQTVAARSGESTDETIDDIVAALETFRVTWTNHNQVIHGLSLTQSAEVKILWHEVLQGYTGPAFEEIAASTHEIALLRRERDLIEDCVIKELLANLNNTIRQLAETRLRIAETDMAIIELREKLIAEEHLVNKATESLYNSRRDQNVFTLTARLQAVLGGFVSSVSREFASNMSVEITSNLKSILRKHQFIAEARVSPETFRLTLYGEKEQMIDLRSLSAGEKQLLLLSTLKALLTVTGRELPVVFDTLIGRLDATHKSKVLRDVLPQISQQVILLVTDTEVDEQDLHLLEGCLGRSITLHYQDDLSKTVVEEASPYELQT